MIHVAIVNTFQIIGDMKGLSVFQRYVERRIKMRFLVDELPYYGEPCPFEEICDECYSGCPKYWDKNTINSENNPHLCTFLIEKGDLYE